MGVGELDKTTGGEAVRRVGGGEGIAAFFGKGNDHRPKP